LKDYPQLLRLELQNLASVAFHLARAVDEPHVTGLVKDLLADRDSEPSKMLTTLAHLPNVRLIVTTNYDALMEGAESRWARVRKGRATGQGIRSTRAREQGPRARRSEPEPS